MKYTDEKLRERLCTQRETVTFVDVDGTKRHGVSARLVAQKIAGAAFTGYGSFETVVKVVANEGPRRYPFATRGDIAAVMTEFPRLPHAQKNPQKPLKWAPQPTFAHTGHAGGMVATVFRSR